MAFTNIFGDLAAFFLVSDILSIRFAYGIDNKNNTFQYSSLVGVFDAERNPSRMGCTRWMLIGISLPVSLHRSPRGH